MACGISGVIIVTQIDEDGSAMICVENSWRCSGRQVLCQGTSHNFWVNDLESPAFTASWCKQHVRVGYPAPVSPAPRDLDFLKFWHKYQPMGCWRDTALFVFVGLLNIWYMFVIPRKAPPKNTKNGCVSWAQDQSRHSGRSDCDWFGRQFFAGRQPNSLGIDTQT